MNSFLQIASEVNWNIGQKPRYFFLYVNSCLCFPKCTRCCSAESVPVQNKNGSLRESLLFHSGFFLKQQKATLNCSK